MLSTRGGCVVEDFSRILDNWPRAREVFGIPCMAVLICNSEKKAVPSANTVYIETRRCGGRLLQLEQKDDR